MNDSLELADESMPSRYQIARYWISEKGLRQLRNDCAWDLWELACFGCGFYSDRWDLPTTQEHRWNKSALERAHLTPKCLGGSNELSNIVLVCKACHEDAPDYLDSNEMLAWMRRRKLRSVNNLFETVEQVLVECEALGISKAEIDNLCAQSANDLHSRLSQIWREKTGTHFTDTWGLLKPTTIALVIRDAIRYKPKAKYSELEAFNPFRNLEIYRD